SAASDVYKRQGLSVWFPDNYIAFKKLLSEYQNLTWAVEIPWLTFLNNYYASDDIKPSPVNILNPTIGNKNDFRLYWTKSNDLSEVRYNLLQINDIKLIFHDNCDTTTFWISEGFTPTTQYYHSSSKSFYSGTGNNLENKLTLKDSLLLPAGGLLSFMSYYETEEGYLLSGQYKRDIFYIEILDTDNYYRIIDSCYGRCRQWTEHRYLLPKNEKTKIRFRYKTDATNISFGTYIDDIKIFSFSNLKVITSNLNDTSFLFFNLPKANYYYLVIPVDAFQHIDFVSQEKQVKIEDYCEPFSMPSPFHSQCKIFCDYPIQEIPSLYIYTLSGELIKKFEYHQFQNNMVEWDGKNMSGKEVADGLYIVLIKSQNFTRIGKIAKVK
ncbi:MAG: hypothetical protein N2748_06470, partial [candidate division WOR-3 bacterium]|nr:hypothetical protein [candidate division WOR-3 bacterium]